MRLAGPLDFGAGAVRTHPPSSLDSQRPGSAQGGFATRSATVAKAQRISNATDARGLDICPTRNECSVVFGCKLSGYKWDPYQLESMKRQALLVIGALVATVLALTPTVAAWYETPVVWASYQNEGGGGYNYGGSTKYGYSGPATDTHPQFYAGAETHTVCNTWGGVCYYAHDVKVTVTGVDPAGATLSGDRFTSLSALHSPSGGTYEEVMNFIYQTLSNAVPYGIGSDIAYLADSQPTGYDSTSAWGQWTACPVFCYPADAGLRFGFQIAVEPGLSGSYRIQVGYHFGLLGGDGYEYWFHLYQDLVYCYQTCTYLVHILTTNRWRGAPPPCQPLSAEVYRDNVKIGTSDSSGRFMDHFQAGETHTYYAKLPPYSSPSQTVSSGASIELCVVTPD